MSAEMPANVRINWPDGGSMMLPTLWLRDVCPCPDCRIEQTQEKRFHLAALESVSVASLCADAEGLKVTWSEGHNSVYPRSFLEDNHVRDQPTWRPWGDD